VVGGLVVLYLLEVVPLSYHTVTKPYYQPAHLILEQLCAHSPQPLLEYPMTQFKDDVDIVSNLTYRTQMMLAQVRHTCPLVNGYSGIIPESYHTFERELDQALDQHQSEYFWNQLRARPVKILKINYNELYPDRASLLKTWVATQSSATVLFTDHNSALITINDAP
jgi:hypothetical protein